MKIELFLANKVLTFSIPQKVSGNFNFDENLEEDSKLINIEAKEGNWYIYSTDDVELLVDGVVTKQTTLQKDTYYILRRYGINYLIFASEFFDNGFSSYKYDSTINIALGNDDSCNITYAFPYIKGKAANISIIEGVLMLSTFDTLLYLNGNSLLNRSENIFLKNGDQINMFGLKIIFLNNLLLVNNPKNMVMIKYENSGLLPYKFYYGESPEDIEVKDVSLYKKEDFFSKSPRMRRTISTKEIKLSPPPRQEGEGKMPVLLTIGPMLTMSVVSLVMLVSNITKVTSGEATLMQSLPSLLSASAMLMSALLWPSLTRKFDKKLKESQKKELIEKYTAYLNTKREELTVEKRLQKDILIDNLITVKDCLEIIKNGNVNFWDKRIEQSDFLVVRLGHGNAYLDVKIDYPEEGFTIEEDELRKQADALVADFRYIQDVPIGYSFATSILTDFMGDTKKCYGLLNNIILQLITFYSYEDIKIVIITNKEKEEKWEYLKYLNHTFSNDKKIRFFSSDADGSKILTDYLYVELYNRLQLTQESNARISKPHYLIITDDYSQIKSYKFTKTLTEIDVNLGFSLIILENLMSKLPSKCNNFINVGKVSSTILKNSFEAQEIINFQDEIEYGVDMLAITKKLSNIPIEFETGNMELPESVTFLEMEKVGKVEQLNIMNRWDSNNSTVSLKTEIGIGEDGNLMYLDLHEKFHGPHGLIAGMTGSGKSEFIITYILSMAMNYSPDDVSFILIDYKGGGLAFAFENQVTGVSLPHLAGIITNLDKAEMDRTLVSIDSEIKRRQKLFNEARDKLGESTIDIYKYQGFFKEGKVTEAIPHLFIISDEFAELKSQQPEFMEDLISVARIGRSLGIHLILATQKPSGVVNDQIWSNSKFRVCLKVQDASDSKEMLKRPDAASLKQTGRFYLQVGYDEYFALGQSAWCGAKYYPSEKIIKQVDKSLNFINDIGAVVKSIQSGSNIKIEAKGEQLSAIMNNIIEVSKQAGKKARKLWLNAIDANIYIENLEKKYDFQKKPFDVESILGEYDAPEKQEQGLVVYSLAKQGNTAIYGNDEVEKENLLNVLIYSICKNYMATEVNIYILDYGSEQTRMFENFPQVGGIAYVSDEETTKNTFKFISEEIKYRKKLFSSYGGSIDIYNSKNEERLPQILFAINNYEGLLDLYGNIGEGLGPIARECERYGISIVVTCSAPSVMGRRLTQSFNNKYTLHLPDTTDYMGIFNITTRMNPRDILGRGILKGESLHEFQTASIVNQDVSLNDHLDSLVESIKQQNSAVSKPIPVLPEIVTLDTIIKDISTLTKVPIGIARESLRTIKYDFMQFPSTLISSNKLININGFMDSLLDVLLRIENSNLYFVDANNLLSSANEKVFENKKLAYYCDNFEEVFTYFNELEDNPENKSFNMIYILYGIEKLSKVVSKENLDNFFEKIKNSETSRIIASDSAKNIGAIAMDSWYSKVKNSTDGIWIGSGFSEQSVLRVSKTTKEMAAKYKNNYGYYIYENNGELMKVIEFNQALNEEEEEDE